MKAIRVDHVGEPEVLQLVELPEPTPRPGEVLVCLKAIGVNPVDTYIRAGTEGYTTQVPFTPGTDGAGIVEAIGDEVSGVQVGDRVYLSGSLTGTYAEMALCTQRHLHPLPSSLTFQQGAAIGIPYATAYRALFNRACARPGESVLIHGASGGVGIAAVQLARAAGLTVLATAGTDTGRLLVLDQGAHAVFDHYSEDCMAQIVSHTNGQGVDIILEMLANVNLGDDLHIMAKGGRVVVIGSRGTVVINPRLTMRRDLSILGMALPNTPEHELAQIHAALVAAMEAGTIRPVVRRDYPLSEASKAHHAILESNAEGKIVLLP